MSDENELLVAIWEHPHDDTVRLVYADWLQENGQPERAEFIRVPGESAELAEDDKRFRAVHAAANNLLKKWGGTWQASLPWKALAAVVVKRDRFFAYANQMVVERVKHVEARHVRADAVETCRLRLRGRSQPLAAEEGVATPRGTGLGFCGRR